jgi:hypothetical protein
MTANEFIMKVLDIFSLNGLDACSQLFWRTDEKYAPITFFVNCNDAFMWGCADAEDITLENIYILEEAVEEINKINSDLNYEAPLLFCAKSRKMRPQNALYKHIDQELWPLFDACGPERKQDWGNPDKHPSEK